MTPQEERAYTDGHVYATEQAIQAHDDLIDVVREAIAFERDHGGQEQALAHHERVLAAMRKVRSLRIGHGEVEALALYRIERA